MNTYLDFEKPIESLDARIFELKSKKVWVHTCSLDHQYALKNYISRGMSVFKSEVFTN